MHEMSNPVFNVKSCFLGKNKKHVNLLSAEFSKRVKKAKQIQLDQPGVIYQSNNVSFLLQGVTS